MDNSELDNLQKQIWDAATLNKDNPLGHRLLDAHFSEIRRLILSEAQRIGMEAIGTGLYKDSSIEHRANMLNSGHKPVLDEFVREKLREEQRKKLLELTGGEKK